MDNKYYVEQWLIDLIEKQLQDEFEEERYHWRLEENEKADMQEYDR